MKFLSVKNIVGLLMVVIAIVAYRQLKDDSPQLDLTPVPDLVRQTADGSVIGIRSPNDADMWLGVPFGKVTQRWTEAEKADPWSGVRQPYQSPDCVSTGTSFGENAGGLAVGSEDCLYLDISAPQNAKGKNLPVMVWVHGGANRYGAPGDLTLNRLVPEQNVILVGVRYRTGPFGYFSSSILRDNGIDLANFGLSDVIKALEWVQTNIAEFGGDPNRVTLFGESAGGRNTFGLLISPKAQGLFHRAIVQSGSGMTTPRAQAENSRQHPTAPGLANNSTDVLAKLSEQTGTDIQSLAPKEQLEFLRSLSPDDLLAAYKSKPEDISYSLPNVIRDGVIIPFENPYDLLASGTYNQVPVIMGANRDENKLYQSVNPALVEKDLLQRPNVIDQDLYDRLSYYGSQAWIISGVDKPLGLMQAGGAKDIYAYRFDWDEQATPFGVDLPNILGASHGAEISFVFGQFINRDYPDYLYDDENAEGRWFVSRAMNAYWAEFARTGKPGRGGGAYPEWQPFGQAEASSMVFDTLADGGVRMEGQPLVGADLLKELSADTLLSGSEIRCKVAKSFTGYRSWDEAETERFAQEACAAK
ncbi:carboxylesterase family protein [Kordiimonas sediminis]|nr:carboxylesterase family protein [Kordiimonas sediminis]